MPPTKAGLQKLFVLMNLDVSPGKLLDCLVYCRGKKLEQSIEPEDYDSSKLVQWFVMNIRTLKHLDLKKVDPGWVEDYYNNLSLAQESIRGAPWKPHPKAYIRRGTGTGGSHLNHIIKSNKIVNYGPGMNASMATQSAF